MKRLQIGVFSGDGGNRTHGMSLPTNAEIEAEAQNRLGGKHLNCESRVNSFIAGARWMRSRSSVEAR